MATSNLAGPSKQGNLGKLPLASHVKAWLTPRSTDPGVAFRERTIRGLIPVFGVIFISLIFAPEIPADIATAQPFLTSAVYFGVVFVLLAGSVAALKWGEITISGLCLMAVMGVAMLQTAGMFGFDRAPIQATLYIMTAVSAAVLPIRLTPLVLIIGLGTVSALGLHQLTMLEQITGTVVADKWPRLIFFTAFSGVVSFIFLAIFRYLKHEYDLRVGEIREMAATLEQRVAERTRDLRIAADISLQITTQLDAAQLLREIVERTAQAFSLSHVSIFLFSATDQVLRLKQGVGEAGLQMVALDKHFTLSDKGLVPGAARTRLPALSNDVTQNPEHVHNPLLPATRAELAMPMLYRGSLIGVLDLQADTVNRFSDEDLRIMRALADQIAIAIRNSQLFEETSAAREEADNANRVKSAFLASMSHELRTPLNAIINFSKFLRKQIPGPLNEEQTQLVGSIADSGQHLLNLINDVLDMSKIESGSLKLYVEPQIDLREILTTAVQYTQPLLANKPVSMHQTLPEELPLLIGDRKRLLQIFLNILSNACKFTEEGHISVSAQSGSGHLLVTVEDSGHGIAAEDAQHVFSPFKQTESGLRQGGGTGLGMPISQKLVEAHQGRIWFESQVGKGTRFFVELPLVAAFETEGSKLNA